MDFNKELDKVKSQIFLNSNGAFFAPLLAATPVIWDKSLSMCETDGNTIWLSPDQFFAHPAAGKVLLLHELGHIARLHCLSTRFAGLNPRVVNIACDYRIDNDLIREGLVKEEEVKKSNLYYDLSIDKDGILSEEEIYLRIMKGEIPGKDDTDKADQAELHLRRSSKGQNVSMDMQMIHKLNYVISQSRLGRRAGYFSNSSQLVLDLVVTPKIPWYQALSSYFVELNEYDFSMKRPNRRYKDFFLPTLYAEADALAHLCYIFDTSGSMDDSRLQQALAEVSFIHRSIRPEKMTIIQFDTRIQQVLEVDRLGFSFDQFKVIGRGGTDLSCVEDWINKNNPSVAVIFSDLECPKMNIPKTSTELVWVCIDNPNATVHKGKVIHIFSSDLDPKSDDHNYGIVI